MSSTRPAAHQALSAFEETKMRLSPFPVPFGQTPDISVGPLLRPERSARSERVLRGLSQAAVIFVPNTPRSPQTLPAIVPYWIGSFTYFPAAPACETISARFSPAKPQQAVTSRLIRHERDAAELCSPAPFPASGSCISQNRNLPCSCGSSIYIPRPFCYNQKKHRTWR